MMRKLLIRVILLVAFASALFLVVPYFVAMAHPPEQGGIPQIPHAKEGHTDCLSCHEKGVNGAPQFPSDHAGRTNDMCLLCHTFAASAPAGSSTTAPTSAPARSTSVATLIATAAATNAPASGPTSATTSVPTVAATRAPAGTAAPARTAVPTAVVTSAATAPAAGSTPAPTKAPATPTGPAAAATPPFIPHTLQGRDQCLTCHQDGVGGAPKVPASHAGRTNAMCQGCHQPKPVAPIVVPTRVGHLPTNTTTDSCVECHTAQGGKSADIVKQWTSSIHSTRGVFCVDCHGGDSTKKTKEEAMSTSAGFVAGLKTQDIPALCASCHARVDLMRQYDLATDQYAQYQESVHGQKLAQGDTNVATCFICHDQHGTKEVHDPTANVYPQNVPVLCSSCHSDAKLMASYGIATNQFALYQKSVHGIALLQKQDPRAPSCATCHGTHGAAPPGFSEVANVCGSCHSATQDYYLKSKHAGTDPGEPKCVDCHGRYDVGPATDAMFSDQGSRSCANCHPANSPQTKTIQQIANGIVTSAKAYDNATAAIARAAGTGLIVAPEEAQLSDAKTNLITARAAQHTLNWDTVKAKTDKASGIAQQVQADAEKSISESVVRRQAMVIGLAVAALAIGCLYLIRRELYKQLPPKE